jgi:hypothetical protein
MELLATGRGIGYLLKSRIANVAAFIDTSSGSPRAVRSWTRRWSKRR